MLLSKNNLKIYSIFLLIIKILFIFFIVLDLYSKYKIHKYLKSVTERTEIYEKEINELKKREIKISYFQELFHVVFTILIGLLMTFLFYPIIYKNTTKITIYREESIYLFLFGLLTLFTAIKFSIIEFNKKEKILNSVLLN